MSLPSTSPAPKRGRPVSFTRHEVLERAMCVFWAKGFAGASLNDLTAAMGIASPSLYAAFGSKENLYHATLDHYVALHKEVISRIMELPTAYESIEGLLRNAVSVYSRNDFPSGCMLEQTAVESCDLSPELMASFCEMRAANDDNFVTRLRKGVEDGDVYAGTNVHAVASFYITVHRGLSLSARGGTGPDELNSVITSAMAAWPLLTGPEAGDTPI